MNKKKEMKRKAFLFAAVIFGMMALVLQNRGTAAAASYRYGDFAVTAISSTSVSIDYRNLYYETINTGASVLGYQISKRDVTADTAEQLVTTASANQVYGTIGGLQAGHEYIIKVNVQYQYPQTDAKWFPYDVSLTLPSSGTSTLVDSVDTSSSIGGTQTTSQPSASRTPYGYPTSSPGATYSQNVQLPAAPAVQTVKMSGSNVGIILDSVACDGYEYHIYKKKTGQLVKTETSTLNTTTLYGLGRKAVYYVQARCYTYDSLGDKIYSKWSSKKYFVPQPKIRKGASKLRKSSITLKWAKVTGATKYTIYMRKRGGGAWSKVKTVKGKKSSCKITRFKGRGINSHQNDYEITIKASAKINGKTYHSLRNNYIYTYTYTRY